MQPSSKHPIAVIIPAFNEEHSVAKVIRDIPNALNATIILIDNHSTDRTAEVARHAGAIVLSEKRRGYGFACLKGIQYLKQQNPQPNIVVFLDADYSDFPGEMTQLIKPMLDENIDFVIGTRNAGLAQKNSLTPQQIFGNWLATRLIELFFNVRYTDLGPFRAIKFSKLLEMNMQDTTFGWTVEMQLKAAQMKLRYCEVPVHYRKRIGKSKISGTIMGSIKAGYIILSTIFKFRFST